ncbi:MAG: response regulator [Chitinophagaceae bacterium]|nr:response regulator [Chitinophagaceae bacterium]
MLQKILLIDDDPDDQFFFNNAIREIDQSIQCVIMENGRQALDYLADHPPPSMIFLDLNMPLMNGFECLAELKREDAFKEIPVTIFTTSRSEADRKRCLEMGAENFISKTVDFKEFKTNIKEVLHQLL